MKAKEIIATVLVSMEVETTRGEDPHAGNTMAVIRRIVELVDTLPEVVNTELHVEVISDGAQAE